MYAGFLRRCSRDQTGRVLFKDSTLTTTNHYTIAMPVFMVLFK